MKIVSLIFSYLILLAACVMAAWGTLGFLEYFTGIAPVMPLQNQTFPKGTQFIHWFLISLSGYTYIIGYFYRWKYTPNVMVFLYGCLATMCFIQTFDFMVREDRYTSYVNEVFNYIIISIYLFKSKRMKHHFGKEQI